MALYDEIGKGYRERRRPDPRIRREIFRSLSGVDSVLNVGAGSGSYEPHDCRVVAVEPSAEMIAQRSPGMAPVVQGVAEALPFDDGEFDSCLAILTLHHWADLAAGLQEMKRVARRRIVIVTWAQDAPDFWLTRDYFPDIRRIDESIFPSLDSIERVLGSLSLRSLLIPADCHDGFLGAFWRRPEAYLDPVVRSAMSTFAKIGEIEPGLEKLESDLASGHWHHRNGELLGLDAYDLGYRVLVHDRVEGAS